MFGVSSVVGPLLGGALTEKVSRRWCFYINLPFGFLSISAVLFLMKSPGPLKSRPAVRDIFRKLDLLVLVLFIPSISCLIIALQWGGLVYPWNNGRVIALWVVFGVTLIAWMTNQAWKGDNATLPPRIFFQRTILSGFAYSFIFTSSMMMLIYYIPLYFQVIKGVSPITSGLYFIPFILALSISSLMFGITTQKVGYYNPAMIASSVVASIGNGLVTTMTPGTSSSHWIGYLFLSGFGSGMALQQASIAAQAVLPTADVSIGIAIMLFGQQLGGAVFLPVAQSVFTHELVKGVSGIEGIDTNTIINTGAIELRSIVPEPELQAFLYAYNRPWCMHGTSLWHYHLLP